MKSLDSYKPETAYRLTPLKESEQNLQTLEYIKTQFQDSASNPINLTKFVDLNLELCSLLERVLTRQYTFQQILESLDQIQQDNGEDNFDLDKESVKELILKETRVGQIFYPSDLANDYGLDLKTVMEVMSELKESKQIIEKPE